MAHAAALYSAPAVVDVTEAPEPVASALRRWAGAQADKEAKLDVYDRLRGTPESGNALVSLHHAHSWQITCWAAVEATMPFDASVAYRVGRYVVYVSPVSGRGLTHRWRRAT